MVFPLSLVIRPFIQRQKEMLNAPLVFGLWGREYIKGKELQYYDREQGTYTDIIGKVGI